MTRRRRHEVREDGRIIAVIEIVGERAPSAARMVELAADVGGAVYRVRIFPAIEALDPP